MKIKLGIVALLCAFNINANAAEAVNGNLDASYASDYYFRGASLGSDSLQFSLGANSAINSVDVFANYFTNQTTGSNTANTDIITVGVGSSFAEELLNVYGGIVNVDNDAAGSDLDVFLTAKFNTLLSPAVSVYRNTDDELYTFEGSVTYKIETNLADFTIIASAGTTDVTESTSRDYVGGTLKISKSFDAVTPHLCLSVVDADDSTREEIVRAGVSFKF